MGSVGMKKASTLICAPLMAKSAEEMVRGMRQAKAQGADVVEIRLDCINNFHPHKDLEIILKDKLLTTLIVYRPKWNGGLYEVDEHVRMEALHLAKELGADYVEFELEVASKFMEEHRTSSSRGSKNIVSCYVNGETPSEEDLKNIIASMQETGADMIKLVTNAADITEIPRIFNLLSSCQVPLIAYSSGDRGLISQILSPKYGGFMVYGSMEGDSIPGLPTLASLREVYKVDCINKDTKVFGLISKPVGHSKGPILHNPVIRHVNFNGVYVPMFVDDLQKFFSIYPSPDFAGFSVGIPYKEAVIGFCDEVHQLAQSIDAANTIIRRPIDGKLVGYNTDCEAAITAIEDALIKAQRCTNGRASLDSPLNGKLFVLVGAGGAGRALAFGAKSRGAHVVVFDIDFDRAKSLACAVTGEVRHFKELAKFQPEKGAILANATPLGMHPNTDRIPVSEASLADYELVFDSVYTPKKTRLLKEAETAGAIIVSGVEMFLRQAIGQFNLFTEGEAPEELMREIIWSKF
ncbi:bifunctional 3-dehydroquinate dehydratase/shikimate dehydrogenase, chloroplastic-like [Humulus lupulus]|uniref:bifunctional 3-dehydroquinate dehydratase/shikimate dehydrogenase, chloroplastic-like n=1 Tax=Humulus lupulus TaxID=3486 RepID=UPI002B405D15|nr:bifunctional 3-dehydroquinate dehydratase/shikimate dehydrogenase, chloroplastic-like [Humulus lupulus]